MGPCPLCSAETAAEELEAHLRRDLGYAAFRCALCPARFFGRSDAAYHFEGPLSPHPRALPAVVEDVHRAKEARIASLIHSFRAAPLSAKAPGSVSESAKPTAPNGKVPNAHLMQSQESVKKPEGGSKSAKPQAKDATACATPKLCKEGSKPAVASVSQPSKEPAAAEPMTINLSLLDGSSVNVSVLGVERLDETVVGKPLPASPVNSSPLDASQRRSASGMAWETSARLSETAQDDSLVGDASLGNSLVWEMSQDGLSLFVGEPGPGSQVDDDEPVGGYSTEEDELPLLIEQSQAPETSQEASSTKCKSSKSKSSKAKASKSTRMKLRKRSEPMVRYEPKEFILPGPKLKDPRREEAKAEKRRTAPRKEQKPFQRSGRAPDPYRFFRRARLRTVPLRWDLGVQERQKWREEQLKLQWISLPPEEKLEFYEERKQWTVANMERLKSFDQSALDLGPEERESIKTPENWCAGMRGRGGGYMLFVNEQRTLRRQKTVLKEGDFEGGLTAEVTHRAISQLWRDMNEEGKRKWNARAALLRQKAALAESRETQLRAIALSEARYQEEIRCHICPYVAHTRTGFSQHLGKIHGWDIREEREAAAKLAKPKPRASPVKAVPPEDIRCTICGAQSSVWYGTRTEHAWRKHSDLKPTYQCKYCPHQIFYWASNAFLQKGHLSSRHPEKKVVGSWREHFTDLRSEEQREALIALTKQCFPGVREIERPPDNCKLCGERVRYSQRKEHAMRRHVVKASLACRLCGATFASFATRTARTHWRASHRHSSLTQEFSEVFVDKRASLGEEMKAMLVQCFDLEVPDSIVTVPYTNPYHKTN